MKFGGFQFGNKIGGWTIINQSATSLPEDLASADLNILGINYEPIWLLGKQIVNGTNYMLVCKVTRSTRENKPFIAVVIINIPPGSIGGKGASVVSVIEDTDLVEGVPLDEDLKKYFEEVTGQLRGVGFTPIMYVGYKITKGKNYYVIAEARTIYPDAEPYAVIVEFNVFQGNATLVSIERLE
jgi:hypothetical protein